jgi:hypothetical protein
METAERILARFVALAYLGDHPDLFSSKADEPEIGSAMPRAAMDRPFRDLG